jgi:hypothetical protein
MKEENKNLENHPIFSEFENIKPIGSPEDIKPEHREETIQDRFYRERREWEAKVKSLSSRIKDINTIASLQVDVYSARQQLVEYYHYLVSLIGGKNAEIRKRQRERLEFYTTGYDFKLDKEQKNMYIRVDLEDLFIIRDEMENHMKYIGSTMGTVDNIIFGIKHRITLEEYKRRL